MFKKKKKVDRNGPRPLLKNRHLSLCPLVLSLYPIKLICRTDIKRYKNGFVRDGRISWACNLLLRSGALSAELFFLHSADIPLYTVRNINLSR
jgi:hypothetical protein